MTLQQKIDKRAALTAQAKALMAKMAGQPEFMRKLILSQMLAIAPQIQALDAQIAAERKAVAAKAAEDKAAAEEKKRAEEAIKKAEAEKRAKMLEVAKAKREAEDARRAKEAAEASKEKIESGDVGEAARVIEETSDMKTPLIIGAVLVVVAIGGAFAYKKFIKK